MEEKLIEFVRNNSVLYDKTHSGYKKLALKQKKWKELATALGKPVDKVKKRWKTIRDRYYRIVKDHNSETTAESGQKSGASEKYKYFDMLNFLRGVKYSNESGVGNFIPEEVASYDFSMIVTETPPAPNPISPKCKAENNVRKVKPDAINSIKNNEEKESPIMMFMKSVALQIEAANFPMENLLSLQSNILTLVKNEIAGRNVTYEVEYL